MSRVSNATRHADQRSLDRMLLALCVAALGITIAYPALRLLAESISSWQPEAITAKSGLAAIRNTVLISFLSVAGAGILGTAVAFFVTRYAFPGRNLMAALAYLPFTLPPLVGTVSFYYLIGRDGFVPRFLEEAFGVEDAFLQGPSAILLIHVYSFYVFFYAMVSVALESLDVAQIEAARTLGAGRMRVFVQVTLPQLMPALRGAALLTFMSSGASFSAPLIFGNDYPMLSVRIYEEQTQHNDAAAMTLTVVLAAVSLLGVLIFRARRRAGGTASKGTRVRIRSRRGRALAGILSGLALALLLLPHATIVLLSFVQHREWYAEVFPTSYTFENYLTILRDPTAFRPVQNSVWMSALAAVATLAIAMPAAYLIARKRRGGRWLNVLVMIPWALPGTVIAVNLIVAFNDRWLPLVGTVWLLPLAYFVRNVPLLTRMAASSIEPFDATLIEAGRTLGASRGYCFRHIVVPLVAPALGAGAALVFATSLGEFVASILLWIPANVPISVQINSAWRGSGIGTAFAYSVFLMLLVAMTYLVSRRFASRVL
ncbi:MAG: iron ABC transporter permease [Candidatus Hydrogenedentes bacterium]|nr:iron ABC transporter permease [Candidatus Hydrogenedentota bacterium]